MIFVFLLIVIILKRFQSLISFLRQQWQYLAALIVLRGINIAVPGASAIAFLSFAKLQNVSKWPALFGCGDYSVINILFLQC